MVAGKDLPTSAEVVIVGGGIVGCSIAFHLTRLGVRDVVLLEQNRLTAGTTWHAAGLVGQLRATRNLTRLARYTTELFQELESLTGQATGFRTTGSISVALGAERFEELKRQATSAAAFGVDNSVISGEDIRSAWPEICIEDVVGGIFLPDDGQTNPVDTTQALARGATREGALILEGICVNRLRTVEGSIAGVDTESGYIAARKVVIAAGMWSRALAASAGVSLPLHAAEHFYIVTEPLDSLSPGMPTLRIPDEYSYYKEDTGKLLLGCFEPVAKPWGMEGIDRDFSFGTLPEDIEHFSPILEKAIRRYPVLETAGIQLFFNGPESFTPDDRYILGETMEVRQLYVAAGFNSIGIQSSGGAGKVLAEWMVRGHPPMDLYDVDIRRTFSFQATDRYLFDRTKESLGLLYAMHWPNRQYESARGVRRSPVHQQLLTEGAVMGELAGWERPNWFRRESQPAAYEYSWGRQNWFENCREECLAIRDGVAFLDQSSYPVFLVSGSGALAALNRISAADVDVSVDRIVYTQWLNPRGGIESDVTITRTGENDFMVVSSCANENRDFSWLCRNLSDDGDVQIINDSSAWAIFGIMGPRSRALLESVTTVPVSDEVLPYYASRELDIGYARVRANRLSYVGELGYELYVRVEFAQHCYEILREAGRSFDLKPAGFHAMDACRMEKGYRHYGHDIGDEIDPFSAGLGFAVDMEKEDFTGKGALSRLQRPLRRRLVNIAIVGDDAPLMLHDEPVRLDGEIIGLTTSGMWGFRLDRSLAIALLSHRDGITPSLLKGRNLTVEVAKQEYPLEIRFSPFYDPKSTRLR